MASSTDLRISPLITIYKPPQEDSFHSLDFSTQISSSDSPIPEAPPPTPSTTYGSDRPHFYPSNPLPSTPQSTPDKPIPFLEPPRATLQKSHSDSEILPKPKGDVGSDTRAHSLGVTRVSTPLPSDTIL